MNATDPPRRQQNSASVIARLRNRLESGRPILCGGARTAGEAQALEAAGCDLLFVTNGLRLDSGHDLVFGLLPYTDANAAVKDMGKSIIPAVDSLPVVAGVCATDPSYGPAWIRDLERTGFCGVQNEPSLGVFDGEYRAYLEAGGICYSKEVDCIGLAHELNLLSAANVFSLEEAQLMSRAGADILIIPMEVLLEGDTGAKGMATLNQFVGACQALRPGLFILVRTRAEASLKKLQSILNVCPGIHGLQFAAPAGASAGELKALRQLSITNPAA